MLRPFAVFALVLLLAGAWPVAAQQPPAPDPAPVEQPADGAAPEGSPAAQGTPGAEESTPAPTPEPTAIPTPPPPKPMFPSLTMAIPTFILFGCAVGFALFIIVGRLTKPRFKRSPLRDLVEDIQKEKSPRQDD